MVTNVYHPIDSLTSYQKLYFHINFLYKNYTIKIDIKKISLRDEIIDIIREIYKKIIFCMIFVFALRKESFSIGYLTPSMMVLNRF